MRRESGFMAACPAARMKQSIPCLREILHMMQMPGVTIMITTERENIVAIMDMAVWGMGINHLPKRFCRVMQREDRRGNMLSTTPVC